VQLAKQQSVLAAMAPELLLQVVVFPAVSLLALELPLPVEVLPILQRQQLEEELVLSRLLNQLLKHFCPLLLGSIQDSRALHTLPLLPHLLTLQSSAP